MTLITDMNVVIRIKLYLKSAEVYQPTPFYPTFCESNFMIFKQIKSNPAFTA